MSDMIKRDDVLAIIADFKKDYPTHSVPDAESKVALRKVADKVKSLPTIDAVSVVHGEWLYEHEDGHGFWVGTCSQCGKARRIDNFCPNCGAKMSKEGE